MSVANLYAPAVSGPSQARLAFLRKVGVGTFLSLAATAVVAVLSTMFIAPIVMNFGRFGVMAAIFGTFALSHWVARGMVYGNAKVPGLALAVVGEGISFGFLLLSTLAIGGAGEGMRIIATAMGITAASGLGMLVYVWFNKSELSLVKAGLSTMGMPMLVLMAVSFVFPFNGVFGLIVCAVFVVASGAALLYRLNTVVHEFDDDMHIEASYEISMALLVLLWNIISLLNRLRDR